MPNETSPGTASRSVPAGLAGPFPGAAGAPPLGPPPARTGSAGPVPVVTVPTDPAPADPALVTAPVSTASVVTGTPPKPRVSRGFQYFNSSSSAPKQTSAPMTSGR